MKLDLKRMSIEALWKAFHAAGVEGSEALRRRAQIYIELKLRGEDVSRYDSPSNRFLPDVASGKLMPELFELYSGNGPAFLEQLATLIPSEQVKLVNGDGRVLVLDRKGDPARQTLLSGLSVTKIRQVIGGGVIRSPKQQEEFVPAPRSYTPRTAPSVSAVQPEPEPAKRVEDYASFGLWCAISDAAEKNGLDPYEQLLKWVPKKVQARGAELDRQRDAAKECRSEDGLRGAGRDA